MEKSPPARRDKRPLHLQERPRYGFRFALQRMMHRGEIIRRRIGTEPFRTWCYRALIRQKDVFDEGWGKWENPSYFEFGVGQGNTLIQYIKALRSFCQIFGKDCSQYRIFAFDSFRGLPDKKGLADDHPIWKRGDFAYSVDEVKARLQREKVDLSRIKIEFIKGYFADALTPELRENLRAHPPTIVTIDVDYYSSTKTVLEWLEPILPSGALLYFDDIWSFHGHPEYGEIAAINEFNERAEGWLIPYPELGLVSRVFVYVRKKLEIVPASTAGSDSLIPNRKTLNRDGIPLADSYPSPNLDH